MTKTIGKIRCLIVKRGEIGLTNDRKLGGGGRVKATSVKKEKGQEQEEEGRA